MPQFDVYRSAEGALLLDCQSDALGFLATRLVVPLLPSARAPARQARLNPVVSVGGEDYVMVTQFAATVPVRELKQATANLGGARYEIINAFDVLLTGV